MKLVIFLTATALTAASFLVLADPGAKGGPGHMAERLKAADTNGDGMISRDEAKALPRILKNFDAIDANHDGQLTMEELHAFHKAQHVGRAGHAGGLMKLDTDKDGRISKAEAQAAPRLAERFDAIDTNHDGFLTPDELKAAHARHRGDAQVEPK